MKESTATDLPTSCKVSDDAVKSFKLDPHLVNLMLNEPFFSHILRGFNKIKTDSIQTAGIAAMNQVPTLFWNPSFLASLIPRHVGGVMKHECYHWIFKHCTARKKDPHKLWNWATDLAINSIITDGELPDSGLFPGKPLDLSLITDPASLAKWKKVSDLIESLPGEQASEWYFMKLREDEEVSDTISGKGEGEGEGSIGNLDDHEGWGDLSDEDRQVVEGKIKQSLTDAVKRCDSSGNWGSVPSSMRKELRKLVSSQIDWRKLLQNFCGRSQRQNKSHTMRRINRKYPYIHPGTKRSHSANIAIYMDESGSVGDEAIEMLFGELNNLGKKVNFTLFPFDTSVDEDNAITWRRGQKFPPTRTRSGGTCFRSVAKHAEENRGKFDGYIILTDGEAGDPGPSRMRRAWVIVPNRKLLFNPHPGDIVINLAMDEKSNW